MAVTILVSFSLMALVVTARPLPDSSQFGHAQGADLQSAVQAIFESRTSQPELLSSAEDEVHVHLTSPKNQQAYLSQLDSSAVKALVPLGDGANALLSDDEKKLYEMLEGSLDDVDGPSKPLDDSDEGRPAASESLPNAPLATRPLVVVAMSTALALLTVLCVGVSLYVFYSVRASLFTSRTAWDLLPKLEKQPLPSNIHATDDLDEKSSGLGLVLQSSDNEQPVVPVGILIDVEVDDGASEDDYHDALDASAATTPRPTPRVTPSSLSPISPLLVPLPPSPSLSPLPKTLHLRHEDSPTATPRPSWAVLAPEDQPQPDPRRAAPALDFALAMQLRPGFGIGADPAWLVRFLMAMFGWVAMLIGGTGRAPRENRRRVAL
ncbi:hypothetical protein FA95DRAFT_1560200 [Auriscalpium vulgare]|uniref:Uncharacterized protein n=1 Tax=Auriscalpium vulgare TaxID=40419 RepID=A0ACB8RQV0_9AGAM|nr:hypothetical protein FA95DRAFT_1560200 [Auriscalpium vulgare]